MAPRTPTVTEFMELYNKIKSSANGYFSPEGVPYHSIETLMVEAPDHGHETTSEAFSYYLWLEAQYGRVTEDWAPFNKAWPTMEKYIIPSASDYQSERLQREQAGDLRPGVQRAEPSTRPRWTRVSRSGKDPLAAELKSDLWQRRHLRHALAARRGQHVRLRQVRRRHARSSAYINTYQRGPQESVWETVPQPSCDTFKLGTAPTAT